MPKIENIVCFNSSILLRRIRDFSHCIVNYIGIFSITYFLISALALDSELASVISLGAEFHNRTLGYWKLVSLILDLKCDLSLILFDDLVFIEPFSTLSKTSLRQ